MTSPKRHRQKSFATSASAFIETMLTPTASISPSTENDLPISNRKESSQVNELIDSPRQALCFEQNDGFHGESKLVHDHIEIISKTTTTNKDISKTIIDEIQSNSEDDWVCPVAVALRRAGYNVPLRPSKSWLERDRQKQALLRKQQTLSKEM